MAMTEQKNQTLYPSVIQFDIIEGHTSHPAVEISARMAGYRRGIIP